MDDQILQSSRRMLGLDTKMGLTPPSSPNNPSNEGNIKEEIDYEVENIPPLETQVEGVVETLEEVLLRPFNPNLTDTSVLVIVQLPSHLSPMSHQRYNPKVDEPTLGLVGSSSITQNVTLPIAISTIVNPQHIGLPVNYRPLQMLGQMFKEWFMILGVTYSLTP